MSPRLVRKAHIADIGIVSVRMPAQRADVATLDCFDQFFGFGVHGSASYFRHHTPAARCVKGLDERRERGMSGWRLPIRGDQMKSWYEMLKLKFEETGDDFSKMVTTMGSGDLHRAFDTGYGGTDGSPFTAWGDAWVYFPICYDGAEWVGMAPRNPCDVAMEHQGGG